MNLRLLLLNSLLSLLLLPDLQAQDDRDKALKALEAEQQQYFRNRAKEEQAYYSERDRAFAQLLKERWRAQPMAAPLKADPMPKRPSQPLVPGTSAQTTPAVDTAWRKGPSKPEPYTKQTIIGKPIAPVEPTPQAPTKSNVLLYLPFYGSTATLIQPFESAWLPGTPLTNARIAQWWEKMAKDPKSSKQVYAFRTAANELNLKGWPLFQLVKTYVSQLPISASHQRMLAWYYLNRLGYDARLGIDGSGSSILLATTDAELYGTTFFRENSTGKQFYFLMKNDKLPGNQFLTYKPATYDNAAKPLEMNELGFELSQKEQASIKRSFAFQGKSIHYTFNFDKNRLNLLATWPQAAFKTYAQPVPQLRELTEEIRKRCSSLSNREKADYLLAMVQNSLAYQEDEKQFGTERHLFPEETLVMPFSDCEDRSFLYATLMKMAFNFDVILVDYPGHVATAVRLGDPNKDDDAFTWKGQTWIICDPTYMNATSGMSMPDFKKVTPEIIALQP